MFMVLVCCLFIDQITSILQSSLLCITLRMSVMINAMHRLPEIDDRYPQSIDSVGIELQSD